MHKAISPRAMTGLAFWLGLVGSKIAYDLLLRGGVSSSEWEQTAVLTVLAAAGVAFLQVRDGGRVAARRR